MGGVPGAAVVVAAAIGCWLAVKLRCDWGGRVGWAGRPCLGYAGAGPASGRRHGGVEQPRPRPPHPSTPDPSRAFLPSMPRFPPLTLPRFPPLCARWTPRATAPRATGWPSTTSAPASCTRRSTTGWRAPTRTPSGAGAVVVVVVSLLWWCVLCGLGFVQGCRNNLVCGVACLVWCPHAHALFTRFAHASSPHRTPPHPAATPHAGATSRTRPGSRYRASSGTTPPRR